MILFLIALVSISTLAIMSSVLGNREIGRQMIEKIDEVLTRKEADHEIYHDDPNRLPHPRPSTGPG